MTPINRFFIKNDIRQEQQGIADLALDIKAMSLLQPIIVAESDGDYEILDGRRRFFALRDYLHHEALEEGTHYIVREGLDALATQYAANEHRQDFTPIEKAALIYEIHQQGIANKGQARVGAAGGWSLADTAKAINRDKGYISRMLQVHEHRKNLKDCRTETECFESLNKAKEKKLLEKVTKAKIKKAKEKPDLTHVFDSIKCERAENYVKTLPTASVDLIHTDPPFAINYDELIKAEYDAPYEDNPDVVMKILEEIIPEWHRVLKDDRYAIIWCGWKQSFFLEKWLVAAGFTVMPSPIVWMKLSTAGKTMQPNIRLGSATLFALCAWKGTPELNIKGRHNYFPYPIVRENRIHQAQMPETLVMDIIKIFSAEGDTVMDCFSGSLSTLRAAYATGRHFVGCEMQKKNIENGMSYSIDWIAKQEKE